MTSKTGITVINISIQPIVFAVSVNLIMVMAGRTGELCIIGGIGMAIGAAVPLSVVFAGIYRKRLGIMVPEFCRLPSGG
jgi:hypothetical protein